MSATCVFESIVELHQPSKMLSCYKRNKERRDATRRDTVESGDADTTEAAIGILVFRHRTLAFSIR